MVNNSTEIWFWEYVSGQSIRDWDTGYSTVFQSEIIVLCFKYQVLHVLGALDRSFLKIDTSGPWSVITTVLLPWVYFAKP